MLSALAVRRTSPGPDFAELRATEFARLDAERHAYLDFTGAALYPESLVTAHAAMLRRSVLGNPHAENPASLASSAIIEEARRRTLAFLDADAAEYAVCFTANATGALAHVAAGYQFGAGAPLVLSADNHNSVNGMREYARRAGAEVTYLPLDDELRLDAPEARLSALAGGRGLFAFPAQSNFSGVKHPLSLVRTAQRLGYRVVLDAAAFVPMNRLSLREVPADFVALSYYKMFGYPTGVGALVARRDALAELRRPWFSGGTVQFVSVQNAMHALLEGEGAFEDGTSNFHAIAAISAGLDYLEELGLEQVERHAVGLALELVEALRDMRHANGHAMAEVYGPSAGADRGATVAFNLFDEAGAPIPYAMVEERARAERVSVRGGCFCNPGASEAAFQFDAGEARACLTKVAERGWSLERFANCMRDRHVGAVRASFGPPSNEQDLRRLLKLVTQVAHPRSA